MVQLLPDLDVSRETIAGLEHYASLIEKWTRKINLISPDTTGQIWDRHIIDSAQLFPLFPPEPKHYLDLGSGGGLPGIVLTLLLQEKEDVTATFIESDARKCAFLRTAIRELGLKAKIHNARIDKVEGCNADVITARALAPLPKLLPLIAPHLAPTGVAILPKGRNFKAEIDLAQQSWHMKITQTPSFTDPEARILSIEDIARVST